MLPEWVHFRNRNVRDGVVALIVVLVAFASFFLGRFSQTETGTRGSAITITQGKGSALQAAVSSVPIDGGVVASKTGTKYHLPWCSGAATIREENKIWFKDAEEARKAGYTPAGNCKGLE